MAVVTGEQARLAGTNHMVTDDITARKTSDVMSNTREMWMALPAPTMFNSHGTGPLCNALILMKLNKHRKYLGNICQELQNTQVSVLCCKELV